MRRWHWRTLFVDAGAPQDRHKRGRRPTAGTQPALQREFIADKLFKRENDLGANRTPLGWSSLTGVGFKGNAMCTI
jgi:hypothetical protein